MSFEEAKTLPKEEIDVFFGLDFFLGQMKKKRAKNQKSGTLPGSRKSRRFK